jgi:toxin ParE1/3/4
MRRLTFSRLAERDLNDVFAYIARDKPEAARRWVQKLKEKSTFLLRHPQAGQARPEFRTGEFRSSVVGSYAIFYREVLNGIEIARVVRGERDIQNL